jgi:segregation and condensation protein B
MNPKALLEAALFVSDKPLSLDALSRILKIDHGEVERLVEEVQEELARESRGLDLVKTPEGYELRVKPEYRESVMGLAPFADLSNGMLRTLALVILKQPIKQSTIVKVQGNKVYGYVKALAEKGLIEAKKHGRTKLLTTSPDFERYFGKSSEEMKRLIEEKLKESK